MTSPGDDLITAAADAAEQQALQTKLEAARRKAHTSAGAAADALRRLRDEARDVKRLEDLSLTSILAYLKGSHDDDMAREAAEHAAAEYDHRTRQARADADRQQVDDLERRLAALGDVDVRFEAALAAKEQWLQRNDDPRARRLWQVAEEQGRLQTQVAELGQALDAGESALEYLRLAAGALDSARSWSAYDTWFDGGMFASMAKHDRLDEAAALLRSADSAMRRFTTELSDVHTEGVRLLELDGFTRTFDVFFDNFFTDIDVRGRIIDAQGQVSAAISGVHDLRQELAERIDDAAAALDRLRTERVDLLTAG